MTAPASPSPIVVARSTVLALVPPTAPPSEPGATLDLEIPRPDEASPARKVEVTADPDPRIARRHRLNGATVKVAIRRSRDEIARGRVRDIAVTGGLYIETRAALPVRTMIHVRMGLPKRAPHDLIATVVRSSDQGMAIMLELDDAATAFLNVFVAVARTSTASGALEIEIEEAKGDMAAVRTIGHAWLDVRSSPGDAYAHQRFIDACLAGQRLDFALGCLRGLQESGVYEPQIERSLDQVGRILGFLALNRAPVIEEPKTGRSRLYVALGLAGLVACALAITPRFTEGKLRAAAPHEQAASVRDVEQATSPSTDLTIDVAH